MRTDAKTGITEYNVTCIKCEKEFESSNAFEYLFGSKPSGPCLCDVCSAEETRKRHSIIHFETIRDRKEAESDPDALDLP